MIGRLQEAPFTYSSCNALMKAELIGRTRLPENLIVNEDSLFMMELFFKQPRVCVCETFKTYVVTLSEGSLTRSWSLEKSYSQLKRLDIIRESISERTPQFMDLFYGFEAHFLQNVLWNLCRCKEKEAKKLYKKMRKEYLRVRKHWFSQKELASKRDKQIDMLIRTGLLPLAIRIKNC